MVPGLARPTLRRFAKRASARAGRGRRRVPSVVIGRLADLDLKLLRMFVAVVDAGGFSLATAKLNVAESTVSQQMTDLETRLGMRLCERGRAGFRLTHNGEQIYRLTLDLMTEIERFRDRITSVDSLMAGTLRVGLPDATVGDEGSRLVEVLAEYLDLYPALDLELVQTTPRELERGVHEGRLHLAVAPVHRRVAGLEFVELFAERNALYCGAGHPLFGVDDAAIDAATLNGCDRIARGYLDRFDAQFFEEPRYRATVHQIEAAAALILGGRCIGFLPEHYAARWVAAGRMRAVHPGTHRFASRFGALTKRDDAGDPRTAAFVSLLRAHHGLPADAGAVKEPHPVSG